LASIRAWEIISQQLKEADMLIKEIRLRNLLSFGPDTPALELKPLNVLIGPNGSGKSNLLEAISLLQAAPTNLPKPIKAVGGIEEWLWKGEKNATASVEVVVDKLSESLLEEPMRHTFSFINHDKRFELVNETIELGQSEKSHVVYTMDRGNANICDMDLTDIELKKRIVDRSLISKEESVLSQFKDPARYDFLSNLNMNYKEIHQYREWSFGRNTASRHAQRADLPSNHLMESVENMASVLNNLLPQVRTELLEALSALNPDIEDLFVKIEGGYIQLYIKEGRFSIPSTRLSDGTLRYLCLLAILCHPEPPPLVCIKEPEIGLHPDMMSTLAKLMIKASERCQLIVTTHSDILVDHLTETPESIIVCEKHNGCTEMQRLDQNKLKEWLKKYSLGELWISGEIGGNRW
jgi:predicted ATPase